MGYTEKVGSVSLSRKGGFFDSVPSVMALCEAGATVRYTTDGSTPTETSDVLEGLVPMKEGVNTIRVRAFREGALPSDTVTQTYFVNVARGLPVVSLVTDRKYTYDKSTGILTTGFGETPNYFKNWEYPINVEYYDEDKQQVIDQLCTFRVTGATSRKFGQKAITLFARGALGSSTFDFNPFSNREGVTSYKALTLRAGGSECNKTHFKDALLTSLAAGENIFYQEAVTCLVYVNGEFYGICNLRERVNKDSLAAYEGVTDEETIAHCTIIKGRTGVQNGSLTEWQNLIYYMKTHSMKDEECLKYVTDRMDVDSYFTNVAFQILTGNNDIGNQRFYKFEGGKWRWVIYDLDCGMQQTGRYPLGAFTQSISA